MCPPRRNGSIFSSSSARPHSAPIPLGAHILWPEIARKSTSSACTSTRRCGAACAASQTKIAPCSCAQRTSGVHVGDRAERVRDEVRRDDLHVVIPRDLVEPRVVDLVVVVERQHHELRSLAARDVLERDEDRVVLELRDDDGVARAEVVQAPRVRDEVQSLGRVADEDDLARLARVQERGHLVARPFEARGRALAEHVDGPVHVRVRRLVELGHRVEHLPRLLRAVGRVEVRERLPVDLLLEDREIGAQGARIQLPARSHRHGSS